MSVRPNIILIVADDLGRQDLGCYGSTFYETPNLDALAARGMIFTDAYAACPVCSPTRASLLSGKYPANIGVTDWIDWGGHTHPMRGRLIDAPYIDHLPLSETSLAAALRAGGYQTWHVGKWHLGGPDHYPEHHGFDINLGGCAFGSPGGKGGYFAPWRIPNLPDDVPQGTHLDEYLTGCATDLIAQRGSDKPFFLNLWPYLVHTPIEADADLVDKYARKRIDMGLDQVQELREGELFPTEAKRHLRVTRRLVQSDATYAAMIETLDRCVGRIMCAVGDAGFADNTVIMFTSDNGGLSTSEGSPTCNAPLSEGKGWMYEGGVREPLIVHWPRVTAPGSRCAAPVTSPDFYPTLLEMAGLPPHPQQHADGMSFVQPLHGNAPLDREGIYWHYPHYGNQGGAPAAAMRSGDWKLIEFFVDSHIELYNLRDDISEDHNLAHDQPDRAASMRTSLVAWRKRMDAKMPTYNPQWSPGDAPEADPLV